MFELPEIATLARQASATIRGKVVTGAVIGASPHKFVWYNRTPEEFAALAAARTVGEATGRGKWLFLPLEPGFVLLFGEIGGRLLYHEPGAATPNRHHLSLTFDDGSGLTAMTQMWGAYELFEQGRELDRQYVKDMRPTPVDAEFTLDYFSALVDEASAGEKRSVKALLTQEQLVPGLGNAIAQDIMFRAGLHPRHPLTALDPGGRRALFDAIVGVVAEAIATGGRSDEVDLFGRPGGYVRLMSAGTAGTACPACGTAIEKIQYLGGACYFCPRCQR